MKYNEHQSEGVDVYLESRVTGKSPSNPPNVLSESIMGRVSFTSWLQSKMVRDLPGCIAVEVNETVDML